MSSQQGFAKCTGKLIAKVLIVGDDPALLAGFLRQVSGRELSYQLYSSMGIGLGVARRRIQETTEVVMQLWSLPVGERILGINASMSRGTRGIIVFVDNLNSPTIESILSWFDHTRLHSFHVVVLGPRFPEIGDLMETIGKWNLSMGEVREVQGIHSIMDEIAEDLISDQPGLGKIRFSVLDESAVIPYEPQPRVGSIPLCNGEELALLSKYARDNGFGLNGRNAVINLEEGRIRINLVSGEVSLKPNICSGCNRDCKRESRICVVGIDEGWSSQELGKRALLVMSKLHAFSLRKLPLDVQNQITYASSCASFHHKKGTASNSFMPADDSARKNEKPDLLDVAKKRVEERKLSTNAYSILRDWFRNFQDRTEE
ncbi:hypothetical protein EU537_13200 [Candidatus Thorarchaeota archaeon]|nr:MAG: hypothetical protein EU537_13200 [Candidatus Thorarchaeota archaeon]